MTPIFVIDTNVVVGGLLTNDESAPTARIVDGMLSREFSFLVSPDLLREYWAVLRRPAIQTLHGLSDGEIETILTTFTANALIREPNTAESAPDPGDQHLRDLLAAVPRATLVTGDRALVKGRKNYSVITPAAMWKIVARE